MIYMVFVKTTPPVFPHPFSSALVSIGCMNTECLRRLLQSVRRDVLESWMTRRHSAGGYTDNISSFILIKVDEQTEINRS